MPRLTASRICLDGDYKLPPRELTLSTRGNTSLVYNHPDEADRVLVYTIERAKVDWWKQTDLAVDTLWVGEARLTGWYEDTYTRRAKVSDTFDVYKCDVKRVSFDFPSGSSLWKERAAAIQEIWDAKMSTHIINRRADLWRSDVWVKLSESNIPAVKEAADFALNWGSDYLYAEPKRDAFCVRNGELFWLDPYHEEHLAKYLSASFYYPNNA